MMIRQSGNKRKQDEDVPAGVKRPTGYAGLSPVDSLHVRGIGAFAEGTRHYQRTFKVDEKHERLASGGGVRFNIETVPPAEEKHIQKPVIGRMDFLAQIKAGASEAYAAMDDDPHNETPRTVRLEAVAKIPDNMVYVGGQGFFAACLSAFAQHLPLAISPDHIWALISYAFAQHVDKHAEELRSNFVQHEGKKRLEVLADHMIMGGGDDPDSGSSPEVWERTIFPDFSHQIKTHIGEKVHDAIAGSFSTTTATCCAAHEITLMSAMKHYFSYGMGTLCGIPNITLLGSEEDWVMLRSRAEALGHLVTQEFSSLWMPVLLPVLDEFVSSYRGQVNNGFWQSMVKLRHRGGSGACSKISGWVQILFPYLKSGRLNTNLRPWQQMYFSGPDPKNIPAVISSAPVDWNYHGTTYYLHFFAGFTGCTQDPSDGTLTPTMGWYVAHDPPSDPKKRLATIEAEIKALLKGHKAEAQAKVLDTSAPWYHRVSTLFFERKAIYESLMEKLKADEKRIAREIEYASFSPSKQKKLKERVEVLEAEKTALETIPTFASPETMIQSPLEKSA